MKETNSNPSPSIDGAFLRCLQEHRQGEVLTDLSPGPRQVVASAIQSGKSGKLTLEITVSPNGNAVALMAEVKTKCPKEKPFAGIFFADDSNNLFRNDPKQPEMPALRSVEGDQQDEEAEPLRKAVGL